MAFVLLNPMTLKPKQRRGIGTVITTLIIFIASVVLGAGVIFFGGSLFQSNTQNEAIQVSNAHIWIAPNGTSSAAGFVVQNTGGKVVSIQSITIRVIAVPSSSWYYNSADATAANVQRELGKDFTLNAVDVTGVAPEEMFIQETSPVTLTQGQAIFVYLSNPAGITMMDAGFDFNLSVHAGRASASISSVHATAS